MIFSEESSIRLEVLGEIVYSVLTRYDLYRDWLPDISHSRILAREGDIVIVELATTLQPSGRLVLEFVQTSGLSLTFTQVDRYRQRGLRGSCELTEIEDGAAVTVTARVSLRPLLLALRFRRQTRAFLTEALDNLRQRALKIAAGDQPVHEGERVKLVEIVKRGDALELWFRGQVFEVTPKPSEDQGP